ncbi:hypothetical protein ACFWP2_37895 [Kitasatospora sp. NPDC058444]|uniref:hypothetical protein n=1 Tax=Kitasatospora sp. NPDC058444 TaxID=3346504 RepID=UPI00366195B9
MSDLYLVDGQPVYAPAATAGGTRRVLHLAVVVSGSTALWAGCGRAGRLDEDGSLFADEVGTGRLRLPPGTPLTVRGDPMSPKMPLAALTRAAKGIFVNQFNEFPECSGGNP